MLKVLCVIWILCGLGLLWYGALESFKSYLIISSTDMISMEGTVVDKYAGVSERYESGRRRVYVWFPQPVVEWVDKSGKEYRSTDPNAVPLFLYKIGQKVRLKVFDGNSQAYVDDLYTRFCFPAAYILLGIVFILLPIMGWRMLDAAGDAGTDIVEDINSSINNTPMNPVFQTLPINIKYFLWAFFVLVAFAAFMAARPYLKGLIPDNMTSKEEADTLITEEAEPLRPKAAEPPVRQDDDSRYVAPGKIIDERSKETALMRALKEKDDKTVNEMMGGKFDVNVKDVHGRTLLFYAVRERRAEAVRRLISLGADLEASSADIMIVAIEVKDSAIADTLLDAGKNANLLNERYKRYPLDLAIYNEMPGLAVRLARQGAKHTAPIEFIEVARDPDRHSGSTVPKAGFSGISLARWIDIVRANKEGRR